MIPIYLMPTLANISPHVSLAPFVRNYSLLKFNTHQLELHWPRYSGPEMCLLFFLDALPVSSTIPQKHFPENESKRSLLKGLYTRFNGTWKFKGVYSIFRIHFTPNGFHSLFNLPLKEFTNNIIDAETVFGKEISLHCNQLQQAATIHHMATITNEFLKAYVIQNKERTPKKGLNLITDTILKSNCAVPIEEYAALANMSLRTFERKFAQQVGTSPKLFCRLLRFNRAIELKLMAPDTCWTSIALECDYYDQMHMVHDFVKFAGSSPTRLFENNALPALTIEHVKRID